MRIQKMHVKASRRLLCRKILIRTIRICDLK